MFLHGDGLHILLNALALWALGRLCEALYGPARFLWLFLMSGICGACFSWLGGNESSVGASGGIFGLMGAAITPGHGSFHTQQGRRPLKEMIRLR